MQSLSASSSNIFIGTGRLLSLVAVAGVLSLSAATPAEALNDREKKWALAAGVVGAILLHKHHKRHQAAPRPAPRRVYKPVRRNTHTHTRRAPAPQKIDWAARTRIRGQQEALNLLGYNAGVEDGISGRVTKGAIRDFQQDNGLASTGRLTPAQERLLQRKVDAHLSAQANLNTAAPAPLPASQVSATPVYVTPVALAPLNITPGFTQPAPAAVTASAGCSAQAGQPLMISFEGVTNADYYGPLLDVWAQFPGYQDRELVSYRDQVRTYELTAATSQCGAQTVLQTWLAEQPGELDQRYTVLTDVNGVKLVRL